MNIRFILMLGIVALLTIACDQDEPVTDLTQFPRIKIENQRISEGAETSTVVVKLTWPYTQEVTVDYTAEITENGEAKEGQDFAATSGTITFAIGDTIALLPLEIVDDVLSEADEKFQVTLSNPVFGKLLNTVGIVTIENDDDEFFVDGSGYEAPEVYQGFLRVWEDDFVADEIDQSVWTHEIGGSGWGNNELQYYTDRPNNSFQQAGYMVIEAKEEDFSGSQYTSARIISQDKFEFQYGRVDIRARLPKGQGLWPALWMLGHDFQEVGWPRCGEIDIMELVGNQPKVVHGTAHFLGSSNSNESRGSSKFLAGGTDFSDEFHVFSIVWRKDYIEWRLDGQKYFSLTPEDLDGGEWSFNDEFFFILNVAVGGNWPGSPDATTVFPQRMFIDYIRLYQLV